MGQHDLRIKFWGVRGSYPVPGACTAKFGGNTSCIEIRNDKHLVILDAGTGIIPLGEEIIANFKSCNGNTKLHITVLLTHTHHDHIQGLPFFKPAYQQFCSLYIFGPQLLGEDLRETLSQTMEPRFCPVRFEEMSSEKVIVNMAETDKLIFQNSGRAPHLQNGREPVHKPGHDDLVIRALRSYAHPKDGVFIFKISMNGKSVVYATDIEGYSGGDSRLIQFAQGADVLIHDAQYEFDEYTDPRNPKQGFGHSTVDMACEVAHKAAVRKLVLFHHDPTHDDAQMDSIEHYAAGKFKAVIAGREGMVLTI